MVFLRLLHNFNGTSGYSCSFSYESPAERHDGIRGGSEDLLQKTASNSTSGVDSGTPDCTYRDDLVNLQAATNHKPYQKLPVHDSIKENLPLALLQPNLKLLTLPTNLPSSAESKRMHCSS